MARAFCVTLQCMSDNFQAELDAFIRDEVKRLLPQKDHGILDDYDQEDFDNIYCDLTDEGRDDVVKKIERFVCYGGYVALAIDIDSGLAVVKQTKESRVAVPAVLCGG